MPAVYLAKLQREVDSNPISARHLAAKTLIAYLFRSVGESARWVTTDLEITDKEKSVIAKTFIQYMDLCNFLQREAQDLLWHKFPGACPYCVSKNNCACGSVKRSMNETVLEKLRQQIGRPRSVRSWQRMFQRIYGKKDEELGQIGVHSRLQGEVTELFDLFEKPELNSKMIDDELADIGAWIFGLAIVYNVDLQTEFSKLA